MRNTSTSHDYPKSLLIRKTVGGMVWQHYIVPNKVVAIALSLISVQNGFEDQELTDVINEEETFPNWKEECLPEIKELL